MNPYPSNTDIFKRLILSYYPPSLLLNVLTFSIIKEVIYHEKNIVGIIFISSQALMLSTWGIIIMALYLLKPGGSIKLLTTVTGALFCGVVIQYLTLDIFLDLNPLPFSNSIFSNKIIMMLLMNIVWCGGTFFLAQRSIVSENKYKKEKTERLLTEKELIENQLSLLQAQIEPQFLFNTMESISGMFNIAPEKAKNLLMYFTQYLRTSLVKTRERYTTIKQEMEIVRSYLDIFKVSMEDRLEYSIDMDPIIADMSFPSMLIQPIVENAVKNSIEKSVEGGHVSIMVNKIENGVQIKISDTGKGLKEENKDNIFIHDVKEYLTSLYREKWRLQLDDNEPSGLSVTVEVPCE